MIHINMPRVYYIYIIFYLKIYFYLLFNKEYLLKFIIFERDKLIKNNITVI